MALTPNDVLNKQFQTTKFRDGYDQDEVDDFLDEVLAEFQRLMAENEQLRGQVAAGSAAPAVVDTGALDAARAELAATQSQVAALTAQLAQATADLETAKEQAAQGGAMLDGMNSAEYLSLARRVHEEHVREGVAKRDELIAEGETKAQAALADAQSKVAALTGDAEAKASAVTTEAETKAAAVVSDAEAKASALVSEAQSQYDSKVGVLAAEVETLSAQRDALQSTVEELKTFERDYRTSLKTYLESALGELAASGIELPPTGAVAASVAQPAFPAPVDEAAAEPVVEAAYEAPETEAPKPFFDFSSAAANAAAAEFDAAAAATPAPSIEVAAEAAPTSPFDGPVTASVPSFEAPASPFDAPAPTTSEGGLPVIPAAFEVRPVEEETAEEYASSGEAPSIEWTGTGTGGSAPADSVEEITLTEVPGLDAQADDSASVTYEIPGFNSTGEPPVPPVPGVGGN